MYEFDRIEKEVEAVVDARSKDVRVREWKSQAHTKANQLAHKMYQAQIDEVLMAQSLVRPQTDEWSYLQEVIGQLAHLQYSVPSEGLTGGYTSTANIPPVINLNTGIPSYTNGGITC